MTTLYESTPFRSANVVVAACDMKLLLRWFRGRAWLYGSYLVDPASSHMLVSKIKPCMSKYKPLYGETANGSLNQKLFI